MTKVPTINDIKLFECNGTWPTKSGGKLDVLFKIDYQLVQIFLTYSTNELSKVGRDIRGLRSYNISGISKGAVGANEWHKIRNEIVYVTKGSILWSCKDTLGLKVDYVIKPGVFIFTPHHILHTYKSLEDDTTVCVLANTLFYPSDPATHDTYPASLFKTIDT